MQWTGERMDANIPVHFVGFGRASLRMAGAHSDGVHLHTLIGHEGLRRAKALIREGAEAAWRGPEVTNTLCASRLLNPRSDSIGKE
jgi:alkanesulfonate monooxygenase SsuD/methylene tetrahydromethanopterin reductase-like flavin-dependent oxidoreductase (luciferase family)